MGWFVSWVGVSLVLLLLVDFREFIRWWREFDWSYTLLLTPSLRIATSDGALRLTIVILCIDQLLWAPHISSTPICCTRRRHALTCVSNGSTKELCLILLVVSKTVCEYLLLELLLLIAKRGHDLLAWRVAWRAWFGILVSPLDRIRSSLLLLYNLP